MFDFSSYSTKSRYYDGQNKVAVGKMKNKTARLGIKEFVELKPKMYYEQRKVKGVRIMPLQQ